MRKCRKYVSQKLHMLMVGTMAFSLSSTNIVQATTISLEENVSEQNQVVIIVDDTQKEETLSLEETEEVREGQPVNDKVEVITPASIEVKKSRTVEPEMKTTEPVQELDIASGDITITSSGTYKIISSVSNAFTTNVISIGENFEGTVILDNIEIEPRMEIAPTAKVTLKLVGENAIFEGIHFGNATTGSLLITADETEVEKIEVDGNYIVKKGGLLYAGDGTAGVAGIGGNVGEAGKNITIDGGYIIANGSNWGAGIGGGQNGNGENITIQNVTIEVVGGGGGAGIGGGYAGHGNNIIIDNATIDTEGRGGAGIGGGPEGNGQNITITNSKITSKGISGGAGIGGGQNGNGENITIKNTNLNSCGEDGGSGIGGGACWADPTKTLEEIEQNSDGYKAGGSASNIIIEGGTVVATGGAPSFYNDRNTTAITYYGGSGIGGGGGCKKRIDGLGSGIFIRKGGKATNISILNNANVTATGKLGAAGIGGSNYGDTQTIKIDGATTIVQAEGQGGSGIGGGAFANGSDITIANGTIDTTSIKLGDENGDLSGGSGAGIGGGTQGTGTDIKISGGSVTSTSKAGGAGIGGGYWGEGSNINISGGTVDAKVDVPDTYTSQEELYPVGAGIGGGAGANGRDITISGGEITATGGSVREKGAGATGLPIGYGGAGIGGGYGADGRNITISAGDVIATGGIGGAGIGGGICNDGRDITILGGNVIATGGDTFQDSYKNIYYGGTGIGGGGGAFDFTGLFPVEGQDNREHVKGGSGQNITISGGTVNAIGNKYSAGIGSGGYDEKGLTTADTITISNATVIATGGENAAGIGGGDKVAGKNITITNANVEATGGSNGAGIGGGSNGAGDTIKVENSVVVATRGENNTSEEGTLAAGIGGGFATQGTERTDSGIQIIGGSVWCEGNIPQDVEPKEVTNAKGEVVKNIKVNTMEAVLLKNVTIEGETTPYATDIDGNIISMYVPERNQIATVVYDADTESNLTKQYKIFPNPTPTKGAIPLLYSEFRAVEVVTKDQYGNKIAGIDVKLLEKYKGYQIDDFSFKTAITDKSQNLILGIHTIAIDETTIPMGYELPAIKELSFNMQENGTIAKTPSSAKASKSDARGTTNKPNAIHRSGKRSYIKKPRKQDNTGISISTDGKQLIIQLHSKEVSNKPIMEVHYTDGWINVDVPVTITATDNSGISTIKINDQVVKEDPTTPKSLEYTHTITASGEYIISVVNKDGKIASETIIISIDKETPTGEIKEVDKQKVLVAKDTGGSGIDHIVGEDGTVIYQVQAGEEALNTLEISLEKVQKYTIYDKAGNTVDVTGSTSGTTDDKKEEGSTSGGTENKKEENTIPPAVIPTIPNPPTVEDEKKEEIQKENRPSLVLDYEKGWTNKDVPVHITATDEKGIIHIVMPDGTTRKPDSTSPKKMDTHHTIKENGNYTYTVVNKDGKETSETITVKIDKIAPTVTVKQEVKQHTLYAKDKESGVSYVVTPSGKTINWKKEYDTNGLKVTENGVYTVYDKAGNKGTGTVSGIEKKKEEPSISKPTVPEQSQKKDQNQKNNQEVEHPYHNENIGGIQIEVKDENGKKDSIYIPEEQVYQLKAGETIYGKDINRFDIDKIYYLGNGKPVIVGLNGEQYYYVKTVGMEGNAPKKVGQEMGLQTGEVTKVSRKISPQAGKVTNMSSKISPQTGDTIYKYIPAFVISGVVALSSFRRKNKDNKTTNKK